MDIRSSRSTVKASRVARVSFFSICHLYLSEPVFLGSARDFARFDLRQEDPVEQVIHLTRTGCRVPSRIES